MVSETTYCKNCSDAVSGKFCSNCGQPVQVKRVDGHYVSHEIQHLLHFEKGILYTVKELLIRPGQNIREFISENRSRLVKPVVFIIITSLIYSLIDHYFHVEEAHVQENKIAGKATIFIFSWIQSHYGYANILLALFIAMWIRPFFKKYQFNFFEILILLCFVMGMGMLIAALFILIEGVFKVDLFIISSLAGIGYCVWAIGQFFDKKKAINYVKSLGAYALGMCTFWLTAQLLGMSIDYFLKH